MNELEIKDLTIHYITRSGTVRAVNDVSFSIGKGETLSRLHYIKERLG